MWVSKWFFRSITLLISPCEPFPFAATWCVLHRSRRRKPSSVTIPGASQTSRSARTSIWAPHVAHKCQICPTPPSELVHVEAPALPVWTPCKCRAFRHWPGMDHRHAVLRRCSKLNRILFLYPTVRRWLAHSAAGVTHCGLAIIYLSAPLSLYAFLCNFLSISICAYLWNTHNLFFLSHTRFLFPISRLCSRLPTLNICVHIVNCSQSCQHQHVTGNSRAAKRYFHNQLAYTTLTWLELNYDLQIMFDNEIF